MKSYHLVGARSLLLGLVALAACSSAPAKKASSGGVAGTEESGGAAGASSEGATPGNGGRSGGSAGKASGGASDESAGAGGAAGDAGAAGDTAGGEGGSGGASSAGGGVGGASAVNGCVKALGLWYVVRNDGHVLAEARDQTKEAAILGPDSKPLANALAATGGSNHGCALLTDGTVSCWRESAAYGNRYGQLGGGTTDQDTTAPLERASQVLVGAGAPLTNVLALTQGADDQSQTCAVTSDGKLYCWGDLSWLVNKGTALVSPYAQAITTDGIIPLTGVVQASISPTMACAVVKGSPNNALYCWGGNSYSNLATGDTNHRQYPTKVTPLTSPTQVAVLSAVYLGNVGGTACAIDGDQLLCWGSNGNGATGTGGTASTVNTPTPVVLTGGTTKLPKPVGLVAAPNGTLCALEPNQTIWCWGNGYQSTAGNYGLTNVSLLGGLFRINAYGAYPLFLTTDGLYHWGMEWSRSPACSP
jgi:alpha-tubulin suppressor-like RCC1 family protein